MKLLLLGLFLMFLNTSFFGQDNKTEKYYIDSIHNQYNSSRDNYVKNKMLYNLAWYHHSFQNYDSSLFYAKKSLTTSINQRYDTIVVKSAILIGSVFGTLYKSDSAIKYLKIGEQFFENNEIRTLSHEVVKIHSILAYMYSSKGDFDEAFFYNNKSEKIYREINDTNLLVLNLSIKAQILNELFLYDKALINLKEAERLSINNDRITSFSDLYKTISQTYKNIGDIRESKRYINLAIKTELEKKNNTHSLVAFYESLSMLFQSEKVIDSALYYNHLAYEITRELDIYYLQVKLSLDKALLLFDLKRFEEGNVILNSLIAPSSLKGEYYLYKAKVANENQESLKEPVFLDSAIYYSTVNNQLDIQKDAQKQLHTYYYDSGKYDLSLKAFKSYIRIKDSIFNKEKSLAIQKVIVQKVIDDKNVEIRFNNLEFERQKAQKDKWIWTMLTIVFVMLFVIVSIYFLYRIQKQKNIITVKDKELLLKENLEVKNELTQVSFQSERNNQFLEDTKNQLKEIRLSADKESKLNSLYAITNQFVLTENGKKEFQEKIEQVKGDFFDKLSAKEKLTKTEKKMAALLKLDMTTKEIAPVLKVSEKTIEIYRSRLRKKLNIDKEISLCDYFSSL